MPITEYIQAVFKPTSDTISALTSDVRKELRSVTWDPKDTECIASFQRIVHALDKGIDLCNTLANQLPPFEVRAAHHILTRAVGQMIQGYVTITQALIAVNIDEVQELQQEGQRRFNLGAHMVELLSRIINRASKQEAPGWWMSGDTLDLAAIAWEGVEQTPMTIVQAANLVRTALAMIPGVTELSDAQALLLLPATVLPVAIADPVLLQERADQIRDVLTKADSTIPDWIEDPDELVLRVSEGVRVVNEQVTRLGFAANSPNSRWTTIRLLADVYKDLVEGPLRDLGSVVIIAGRAVGGRPNSGYISAVARGVQAGDAVNELQSMGSLWRDAVQMLLRNASAHAGVRVLDDGVEMTQRTINDGVVVDEQTVKMSDAEFAEEFARLSEVCLALQLGIIPWLFTHQSEHVVKALQTASPTQWDRESVVRLLAGLQGLLQVAVGRDGNTLIVRAEAANGTDASSPNILSLVPAIFHSWADVDAVTLHISPRSPVTYERAELPGVNPLSGEQDLVAVGLMARKWQGDLLGDAAIGADITNLVAPHLKAVGEAFRHANASPISVAHIEEAHAWLVSLKNRLRRTLLPSPSTRLVSDVQDIMHDADRVLDRLRWAFIRSDLRERQRQARSFAALNDRLMDIARRSDAEFARVKASEQDK